MLRTLVVTFCLCVVAFSAGASGATTKPIGIGGLWLTDLGLMELEQHGDAVTGRYTLKGTSEIAGTISGRRFEFGFKSFVDGKGFAELSPDGKTFASQMVGVNDKRSTKWRGRRADEFVRHAKLVAGKIVDGSTNGLLTYSVRAPEGYREGDQKKWPTIVILHGSNMSGKAYVNTMATAWPDIAKDFLIIGINGERPSDIGDEPAFNYTYVDYVGRSTFKGYPRTDRESPALVAEAMDELGGVYPVEEYFVGGHSQGGFLTYSLLMNFPEKIAGAFPISAGVIVQCEPSAFAEEKIRAAQRKVPLAIVHGKQDDTVAFAMGEHAAKVFGDASWPAMKFFTDDGGANGGAGHRFAMLPVDEAIRWLAAKSRDDATTHPER